MIGAEGDSVHVTTVNKARLHMNQANLAVNRVQVLLSNHVDGATVIEVDRELLRIQDELINTKAALHSLPRGGA